MRMAHVFSGISWSGWRLNGVGEIPNLSPQLSHLRGHIFTHSADHCALRELIVAAARASQRALVFKGTRHENLQCVPAGSRAAGCTYEPPAECEKPSGVADQRARVATAHGNFRVEGTEVGGFEVAHKAGTLPPAELDPVGLGEAIALADDGDEDVE
eukprot:6187150-Prymnesium_polylepis.1